MGFEKIAKYYSLLFDETARLKNERKLLTDIINSYRPHPQVLDLGCGTGMHSRFFATYGAKVMAVDISPTMLHIAKENSTSSNNSFYNIDYIVADITSLPFNSKWDIILLLGNTLSLITDDEILRNVLQSLYNLTRLNGCLLIQVVNYNHPDTSKPSMKTVIKDGCNFSATIIKTIIPSNELVYLSISYFIKTDEGLISDSETNFIKKRRAEYLTTVGKESGYELKAIYGDFQGNPFDLEKSKDIILLFRKDLYHH